MLPNFLMSDRTLEKVWSQDPAECGGKCSFGINLSLNMNCLMWTLKKGIDITDGAVKIDWHMSIWKQNTFINTKPFWFTAKLL